MGAYFISAYKSVARADFAALLSQSQRDRLYDHYILLTAALNHFNGTILFNMSELLNEGIAFNGLFEYKYPDNRVISLRLGPHRQH